jgi:hypothetical protein
MEKKGPTCGIWEDERGQERSSGPRGKIRTRKLKSLGGLKRTRKVKGSKGKNKDKKA